LHHIPDHHLDDLYKAKRNLSSDPSQGPTAVPKVKKKKNETRRTRRLSIGGSQVSSSSFKETLRKAGRKEVIITLDHHGPLGLEIITGYVHPTAITDPRVVIEVVAVVPGSTSEEVGIRADDWLEEIGTTHIDLLGDMDSDHDGKISLAELTVLLASIRAIAPHGTAKEHTAKELMDMYDKDHSHFLEPVELVNLVNEELLHTINAIMGSEVRHHGVCECLLAISQAHFLISCSILFCHSDRLRLCSRGKWMID
tara:strand:- start:171 stop:932 length:762 start_codon:yes stop_codon:yes gene_type:complete